jgi:hypothetical protein
MEPPLAMRFCGLNLVGLRNCREQCSSLGDLRHLRRWRKAFERRRENGVGIRGAGGRLIELGERQSCAQTPTSRALLLCDCECGSESFLRGGGIGWIALEQEFAAQKVKEG